jgi:hypothetical protein
VLFLDRFCFNPLHLTYLDTFPGHFSPFSLFNALILHAPEKLQYTHTFLFYFHPLKQTPATAYNSKFSRALIYSNIAALLPPSAPVTLWPIR